MELARDLRGIQPREIGLDFQIFEIHDAVGYRHHDPFPGVGRLGSSATERHQEQREYENQYHSWTSRGEWFPLHRRFASEGKQMHIFQPIVNTSRPSISRPDLWGVCGMIALLVLVLLMGSDNVVPELPPDWRCGYLVQDLRTGRCLLSRDPDRYFRPASTVKLVTTLLAMRTLGPSWVYRTEILVDTLEESIYLVGSGAPLLSAEDVVRAAYETAAALPHRDVWKVYYDVSAFEEEPHCLGWHRADWDRTYCPPIEALCIGDNVLEIILGTRDGELKIFTYPPLPDLQLRSGLILGGSESLRVEVEGWDSGLPSITLEGGLPSDTSLILYKPFAGAPFELASWLGECLRRAGLDVSRPMSRDIEPAGTLLTTAVMYSDPMFVILTSMNKWSRNMVAEQVLRTVALEEHGEPASTGAGCDLAGAMLGRMVPGSAGLALADGSGLSRLNRLTPRHLVAVLEEGASSTEFGPEFLATLPVNGMDGTLGGRLGSLPPGSFRGKTGTLGDTSALAGLLVTESGKRLLVAIIIEIPKGMVYRARRWQDRFVENLYSSY
ncbi:D-alanyl-D-alanine carboxypeptidase/D-alanyl-D-alanine-endopeptidase [Candidatus Fermentibacteria bacterium]|nr:D-alanyl-D-alanine carboxypeptidase/D-alanyl-D-alanine-endopeptidase [Candidatus Fermentibacteria bacterium]